LVYCSRCGEELSEDAFFCSKCGDRTKKGEKEGIHIHVSDELKDGLTKAGKEIENALSLAAREIEEAFRTAVESIRESRKKEMLKCPNCGEDNPKNASFCHNCGNKLD
jgi:predicted amidophosphoribosyltransferase